MKEMVHTVELQQLETLLTNVERRAASQSSAVQKARMFNLAGDLCFDANQPERALSYYEQAINTHIQADQYDSAISICKKLVALTPQTVRVRYTLAWLTTTRGFISDARHRVEEYASAAEAAGLTRIARKHLRGLAEITSAAEVLDAIAENLMRLGDAMSADMIYGELARMGAETAPTT